MKAENEGLKKRLMHLEAMMEVARAEVHRMDVLSQSKMLPHNAPQLVNQDVAGLQKKLLRAQADKKSLVQTLRQMLAKNSTKIYQKQAEKAVQAKTAVEMKYTKERHGLEAKIKEANERNAETKELAQTLQEQNMDLQKTVHGLRSKLAETQQKGKDLTSDKANLVETMHNFMRENGELKKKLEVELHKEKAEAGEMQKEITTDKVKIANLTSLNANLTRSRSPGSPVPKALKVAIAKKDTKSKTLASNAPVKKSVAKNPSIHATVGLHMKHSESMAAKMARMKNINKYIDGVNIPAEDSGDAAQKQGDVFARDKQNLLPVPPVAAPQVEHTKGISDWLGIKAAMVKVTPKTRAIPKDVNGLSPLDALDPQAAKEEKVAAAKKVKDDADDGGDGIQNLLAQAKGQLQDMDEAEAGAAF